MESSEGAIDLSVRPTSLQSATLQDQTRSSLILKPTPKPPWAIRWYQNLWPFFGNYSEGITKTTLPRGMDGSQNQSKQGSSTSTTKSKIDHQNQILGVKNLRNDENRLLDEGPTSENFYEFPEKPGSDDNPPYAKSKDENKEILLKATHPTSAITVVDIATCDGPVLFDRVLNPNFAVTVEHHELANKLSSNLGSPSSGRAGHSTSNTQYLCICCNQSFKSLFCYQKHKKRHLNPVTVDITSTNNKNLPVVQISENRSRTKDLNVQFFPCKKCGSKFPSYYFVHKHKKVCHQVFN